MDVLDRMGNQGHPEEDHLERYVMRKCSEDETEAIEDHLLVCEPCQKRLRCAEDWVKLMKTAVPLGPGRSPLPRWRQMFGSVFARPQPMALAGCVAFAALLCTAPFLLREPAGVDQVVTLSTTRGAADQAFATASAANHLILEPDLAGLTGPLELQVVDSAGAVLFAQALESANARVSLDRKLKPGVYWVRINSAETDHANVRESGLKILR
jgi:hypothetical protein